MDTNLIENARRYVKTRYDEDMPTDLVYHDYEHTLMVEEAAEQLGQAVGLPTEDMEIVRLAALFHDIGHLEQYTDHETPSKRIAREYLTGEGYPAEKIAAVEAAIEATRLSSQPEHLRDKVLRDADLSGLGRSNYPARTELLRHEWRVFKNLTYTDVAWYKLNRKFLKEHEYSTDPAKAMFDSRKKKNRKKLKKMRKSAAKSNSTEDLIDSSRSGRMMFKTALRNHIDLSNLADNKANIMLSVNALIITISMPLLASNIANSPYLIVPAILLMLTCVLSIIFATLGTRPIKMKGETSLNAVQKGKTNLFFFGNFYRMDFDDYRTAMKQVLGNEMLLDSAIMKDLYSLGAALGTKYANLRICYNIFMFGIITTVVAFGVAYALSPQV